MNEAGAQVLFLGVWVIVGVSFAYRLLFTPEWIDQHVEKMERRGGQALPTKQNRFAKYRFVGIVLLLSSLLALTYIFQDLAGM